MQKSDRIKIDKSIDELVNKINMIKFWPKLFQNKIFNTDDVNVPTWEKNLDDEETKRHIFVTIKTRGPYAYQNLLQSLREINQNDLIDALEKPNYADNDKRRNNNSGNINTSNHNTHISNHNSDNNNHVDELRNLKVDFNPKEANEPLKVKVIKTNEFLDKPYGDFKVYPMRSDPRGLVLIITLIQYKDSSRYRNAAEHDETNLAELFKQMGFEVVIKRDLTIKQMREVISEFTRDKKLRYVDSCFLIISGHGSFYEGKTGIQCINHLGFENEKSLVISCEDIIDYFSAQNCPYMMKKPKVIIFQVCRGDVPQSTVGKNENNVYQRYIEEAKHRSDASSRNFSDLLVAYSTLPGNISFRDNITGTWFIQIMCNVFMKYAHRYHILDLFQIVDNQLEPLRCEKNGTTFCQTSFIEVIGFKHLYLNPGRY